MVVEGSNITLQCKVTGANPKPNITWYGVSTNSTPISYEDNLTFTRIPRSHAGKYYCVVDNGIGDVAESRICTVDVQCKYHLALLFSVVISFASSFSTIGIAEVMGLIPVQA